MASSSTSSINEKTPAEGVRAESGPQNESATRGGMIDKSLISAPTPGSFVHVAHVGYEVEKGFTTSGVDPSWLAFLGDLQKHGISEDVIEENMDFIKRFVRDAQKSEAPTTGNSPARGSKKAPNPPRRPIPPPPPQRRRSTHAQQQGSTLSTTAPPLAPPLRTQSLGTHHPRTSHNPTSASILVAPQLPVRAPPPSPRASVAPPPVPAPKPSSCAVSITSSPPGPRPGEQGTLLRHTTTTTTTTTTTATTTTTVTTTTTTTHPLPNDG